VSEVFQRNWIECHANDGVQLNKPVSAPVQLSILLLCMDMQCLCKLLLEP